MPIRERCACLAVLVAVSSCAAQRVDHSLQNDWLERSRAYAIEYCIPFYDDSDGVYEITVEHGRVIYAGSTGAGEYWSEVFIVMSSDSDLELVSWGDSSIYPLDILNRESWMARCQSYNSFHDSQGRPTTNDWRPYAKSDPEVLWNGKKGVRNNSPHPPSPANCP